MSRRIILSVIALALVVILSLIYCMFNLSTGKIAKRLFFPENGSQGLSIIDDKSVKLPLEIWKSNRFIAQDRKLLDVDSLLKQSPRFFIFVSQKDCDYCVHLLICQVNNLLDNDQVIIVPLCSDVRLLQFCKKNYQTEFSFYTTCPNDSDWINRESTPFIAYVLKDRLIKGILSYNPKDSNQLISFIHNISKKANP